MSNLLSNVQSILGKLGTNLTNVLNRMVPPEKRAEMLSQVKSFAINNPKLAAFTAIQIILTGLPLILFITFSITVFVFSLIAALLIGLLAAVLFTLFMVGVALLVVLPTIFMTTFTATFLFLWGLGGYRILKWLNEGDSPAPSGKTIGDKINNFTGGRMSWLMDGVKEQDGAHAGTDKPHKTGSSEKDKGNEKKNSNEKEDSNEKPSGKAPRKLAETPKTSSTHQDGDSEKKPAKNPAGTTNAANKVSDKTDNVKEEMSDSTTT